MFYKNRSKETQALTESNAYVNDVTADNDVTKPSTPKTKPKPKKKRPTPVSICVNICK